MMKYAIVREGTTTPLVQSASKRLVLEFDDKTKADEVCRRMNGSLDPPGSPTPDPPYVVIEQ